MRIVYEKLCFMLYNITMLRKIFLLFISFIVFISCTTAQPNKEISVKEINSFNIDIDGHNKLKEHWHNANITSYQMEVSYNAFGPKKGIWKIKVENGILTRWEIKDRVNLETDKAFAMMFIQENLYTLAEQAYNSDTPALFITTVVYDPVGYIKEIVTKTNPDIQGAKPTDKGFRIKIIDFKY